MLRHHLWKQHVKAGMSTSFISSHKRGPGFYMLINHWSSLHARMHQQLVHYCRRCLFGTCRSNEVVLETSCLIQDGPDASEDIAACNQQASRSLSRTAPAQAACYQQAGKSLSQIAPAQAALPQQKLQAAQQKTQKRKAARGLAALDYAVRHL